MSFLRAVPTTWDETRVLNGAIGKYVTVARKHADTWYIGAMTDWTQRELELDLSFLARPTAEVTVLQDGINADRFGSDWKQQKMTINISSPLRIHLAPGGGWVAVVTPRTGN